MSSGVWSQLKQQASRSTCWPTQATTSPPTGLGFANSVRPLAFHFALSLRENAAGSRLSSIASSSSPVSTAMSEVEVVVADGIELALNELNRGVGFFGAEGLPKLNAGWVENAEPDGLELNMVVSAAASAGAELENAGWCCCARRLHHGRSQKSIATMTPRSAPRDHIAVLPTICIVAATHLDRCYNTGL